MCFLVLLAVFGSASVFITYVDTKAYKTKEFKYSLHVEALQDKVIIRSLLINTLKVR